MARVRVNYKYTNACVCKVNVRSPSERAPVSNKDYRKAKTLSDWLAMKYGMSYKQFVYMCNFLRKQLRSEFYLDTHSAPRSGDKLLNEKRLLCRLYLYGVSRDALLSTATNKNLASTWFDEMDSRTSDFEALDILREDGMQLEFMERQTIPMCLEAVIQNPESLQFVKNQTVEVCVEATRYCRDAAKYIRNPEMRTRVLYMLSNADK